MRKTICIAGKNEIAVHGLKEATKMFPKNKIIALCDLNDEGFDTWQPSYKKFANFMGVDIVDLKDCYEIQDLVFISLEYHRLINPKQFSTKELYNIHFSKLPEYKGMYTSAWPLLNGTNSSGVTLHKIDEGIDTGEIIDQVSFNIQKIDSARELYFEYLKHSKLLISKNLIALVNNSYKATPQTSNGSSYYSKNSINYKSLELDLKKTAFEIYNQIRAFNFRDYQLPKFNGWGINRAKILDSSSKISPGRVIGEKETSFIVSTIDYDIKLYKDFETAVLLNCSLNKLKKIKDYRKYIRNFNFRSPKGWTPLIIASFNGYFELVKYLVSESAEVELGNYKDTRPIMYAFNYYERHKDRKIYDLLLKNGASLHSKDYLGKTVIDYMKERGNMDLIKK